MYIENTGLEHLQLDLNTLDEILPEYGLIRAGQWDYERVTYDRKIVINNNVYYLRVQGYAVSGDVGAHDAIIQLKVPILESITIHMVWSMEKMKIFQMH